MAAHVSNNSVGAADFPELIARVHGALAGLRAQGEPEPELAPAVSIRASVKPDHLVCFEDGAVAGPQGRRVLIRRAYLPPARYSHAEHAAPDRMKQAFSEVPVVAAPQAKPV